MPFGLKLKRFILSITTDSAAQDDPFRGLLKVSAVEEADILDKILAQGIDQGWFIRPDTSHLVTATSEEFAAFLEGCAERPECKASMSDPWMTADPGTEAIHGEAPGYVVLTQRCDLIRGFDREPLVELAAVRLVTNPKDIREASKNSPRFIQLADAVGGGAWVVDLRLRAWIPKHLFVESDATYPLETPRARKRFRLRVGQRYWRDPVPDDVDGGLQRPLMKVLDKLAAQGSPTRRGALMSEWMGVRTTTGIALYAIIEDAKDRRAAEDAFRAAIDALPEDAKALIDEEASDVFALNEISFGAWLEAFKFSFDSLTYTRPSSASDAEPRF